MHHVQRRGLFRWVLLAAVLPWLGACASSGSGGRLFSADRAGIAGDPWELPAGSFPSQRLYRVKYQGPEGKAGFKLTLYLGGADHYRMAAADSLGRKLWSLEVDGKDRALWLNHRRKEYCETRGAAGLVVVPLANLPLIALPKLLLGRVPGVPVAYLERGERHLAYLDLRGQKWTAVLAEDGLEWWSLEDSGETVAWWRRDGDGGSFSNPAGGQVASWQEIVREVLAEPLAALEIPDSFSEGACGDGGGRG